MNSPKSSPQEGFDFSRILRTIIVAAIILIVFLFLIAAGQLVFFFQAFGWLQHYVRNITGADVLITNGITAILIAIIFTLPLWAFLRSFMPFPQKNKKLYRASVFVIFAILAFASHFFSRDVFFDPDTGAPLKYYTTRPDGQYQFYSSGGYDRLTGDSLRQITQAVILDYLGQTRSTEEKNALGMKKQKDLGGHEAFLATYRGTVTNATSGTVFFFIAPRQGVWSYSDFTFTKALPTGTTIGLELSEGTHYFVVLNADGRDMRLEIPNDMQQVADTGGKKVVYSSERSIQSWRKKGGFLSQDYFLVGFNGENYLVHDFFSVYVGPKKGWGILIGSSDIKFFKP